MEKSNDKSLEIIRKAKICFASGQLKRSVELFSLAEKECESHLDIWMSRGAARMAMGQYRVAADDFTKVLVEDPKNERAHYFRGVAEVALGQYEAAIADLTQSLVVNHGRGIAYLLRGIAYAELGQTSNAELDINSATAFSSAEFDSFTNLFGELPDAFKNSRSLLSRDNAPWNNLLSRVSAKTLLKEGRR